MDVLLFSLNAVGPVMLVVALGIVLRGIGLLKDEDFIAKLNKFCFQVAFAFQLFANIYGIDFAKSYDGAFIAFGVCAVLAVTLGLVLLVPRFLKSRAKNGAFIQGVYRGNFLLMGLPLAANMFGDVGRDIASMMLPIAVPIYNFLAVVILQGFAPREEGVRQSALKRYSLTLLEVIKNPLIIASVLALVLTLLKVPIPGLFTSAISSVGSIASPIALLLLGAQCTWERVRGNMRHALSASILRLVIVPAIVLSIAIAMGFRDAQLGVLMILFCAPTAVSSYVMAKNMHSDADLAGQIVVTSTLLSALTLFGWTFVLRLMEYI